MNFVFNITAVKPLISLDTSVLQVDIGKVSQPFLKALIEGIKPGKYELKKVGKKRSLDANNYCWKLCTEIANVVGNTKDDVYRDAINHVGVSDVMQFFDTEVNGVKKSKFDAMADFKRKWYSNGTGWFTKTLDKEKCILQAYYGSSRYDTKEMARLIDWLVDQAQELGVPTMSDNELKLMIGRWKE